MNALLELQRQQIDTLRNIEDDLAAGVGDLDELQHNYVVIKRMVVFTARQIARILSPTETPEDLAHHYEERRKRHELFDDTPWQTDECYRCAPGR